MKKLRPAVRNVLLMCLSMLIANIGLAEPTSPCVRKPTAEARPAEIFSITLYYMPFEEETLIPTSELLIKTFGARRVITSENDTRRILSLMRDRVPLADHSESKVGRRLQASGYEGNMVRVLVEEYGGEHRFYIDRSGVIRDGKQVYVIRTRAYRELGKLFDSWSDQALNESLKKEAQGAKK